MQMARLYSIAFWSVFGGLTVLALAGLGLDLAERYREGGEPGKLRRQYLKAIAEKYKVFPLVIDRNEAPDMPDIVYQQLTYNSDTRPYDEASATRESDKGTPVENIEEVLEKTRCAVILGRPRGGKTALLRHSMSVLARKACDDDDVLPPIYISLPRFAPLLRAGDAHVIETYLRQSEQDVLADMPKAYPAYLQTQVENGAVFLFLDARDEVDEGDRPRLQEWIRKQQRLVNPRGGLVVSTRYTDYTRNDFILDQSIPTLEPWADFSEWVAQDMNLPTRQGLAKKLIPVLLDKFRRDHPDLVGMIQQVDPDELATRFADEVDRHRQGVLWGRNPLLFTLAAYVYVQGLAEGQAALPASRITLYRQAITALLAKVVRSRHEMESQEERASAIMREMVRVLAEFGLWLTDNATAAGTDSQSFTTERLEDALEEIK